MKLLLLFVAFWGFLGLGVSLQAQWITQSVSLQPGWNAVFLEVQPEPRECDAALADLPVESVWRWNRRFSSIEFIDDPNSLVPGRPDWLVYFPSTHPLVGQTSLYTLEGGRPYLIKLHPTAGSVVWLVKGKAMIRPVEWLSDSLNFVGFSLPETGTPTFRTFFNGSNAHTAQSVYRLGSSGYWEAVPVTASMRQGEAFWIRCQGQSAFQGPVDINLARRSGMDYGRIVVEDTLTLRNTSPTNRTVQLKRLDSEPPPPGAELPLAGPVPLRYWKFDPVANEAGWTPFPATLSKTLVPGESWQVRLEVRRVEMAAPAVPNGTYQSLLEVTDAANTIRKLVPVTAQGPRTGESAEVDPRAGLWVGHVEITHVSQPASTKPEQPLPVASPFSFRLLVHVDGEGRAQLLQKVLQMWRVGRYRTNLNGFKEVEQPGQFVLVTDDRLVPNFSGAALRDGEPVARRFSSAAFGFRTPLPMVSIGQFGADGSQFSAAVFLDYNDPLNPFKHTYHPDHDNLDDRHERRLPDGKESFAVTRNVKLQFSASDPDSLAAAGWGDSQIGGTYYETVSGLHKSQLYLLGRFRLQQANHVAILNE